MLTKNIAVLMTCFNRKEKTLACLKMLFKSKLPEGYSLTVYLVDDGSSDGTAEAISEKYPDILIIQGTGELFWSRGMHLAWKTAAKSLSYDYYLWLNDDTYIFSNTLEVILSSAEQTDNEAIIIAATCSKDTGKLTYCANNSKDELIIPEKKLIAATVFSGNCVLIPKYVHNKLGNIDPLFHHAIGDNDYALRAVKNNIKAFVAPGFLAHCEKHENLPNWCLPSVPLKNRISALYSPLGHSHPYYFFRYRLRHFGPLIAVKDLLSIHLRLLFPNLWKK